ncbi:MAG: hypothetical protein HDQ91_05675 [Desulfovibrio sp.]|nr:hypothetical protein [Desulfovibrio sp.]
MFRALLLIALLCGCEGDADQAAETAGSAEVRAPVSQKNDALPEPAPPTPEAVGAAEKLTAFANRAGQYLEHGFYSLADILHANSQTYLKTFSLPARPDAGPRQPGILGPETGLFDEAEARELTSGWQDMDKALDALLGHYANLEKYVADRTIRDDGKLGSELAAKIAASHEQFVKARHSWLNIVQRRANEAQHILLYEHPLERQILAGENIFSQIREANDILASGTFDAPLLQTICSIIRSQIDIGAKPPFPARPALERLYRGFLKTAAVYADHLEQGSEEGIRNFQRRELGEAARACALAWNKFAREANHVQNGSGGSR